MPAIARNGNTGPSVYKLDLRVAREIRVGENAHLELLGESFNIFNHTNYTGFNTTLYTAPATTNTTPLATPILLTASSTYLTPNSDASPPDGTNARRFQLSVRFRF